MAFRKVSPRFEFLPGQQQTLENWTRSTSIGAGLSRRAQVILLLAEGCSLRMVSNKTGMMIRHIQKWESRFQQNGLDGLSDLPRSGRPPTFSPSRSSSFSETSL